MHVARADPVGVPLGYLGYLGTHVSRINPSAKSISAALRQRGDDPSLRKFDFLFIHYKPSAWYTEAVEAIRRVFMTGGLVIVSDHMRPFIGFLGACFSLIFFREVSPCKNLVTVSLHIVKQ